MVELYYQTISKEIGGSILSGFNKNFEKILLWTTHKKTNMEGGERNETTDLFDENAPRFIGLNSYIES